MAKKLLVKNKILKRGVHYLTSDYKSRNENRSTHNGMDFVGSVKQDDIVAIEDGVVNYVGYDKGGGGNWISIKTNGIEHRYFHLANNTTKVKVNDKVKKGEVIATMGETGNATGYNVHFAIYKNGYVDPLPYLMNDDPFNIKGCTVLDDAYTTFVKSVQALVGVEVSGIAGEETLNNTITISKNINRKNGLVKVLQIYFQELGYDLGSYGVDGVFGSQMEKIVKQYQKEVVKLSDKLIDGIITAKKYTWKSLLKL